MRMISFLTAAVVLSIGVISYADGPSPTPVSPSAKGAINKASQSEKVAKVAFDKAMVEVKITEIADLKESQKQALAANDLKEATAIASLIDETQQELDAFSGKIIRARIAAKGVFQSIGTLPAGKYFVTANGRWSTQATQQLVDANGTKEVLMGINCGTLVARLNGKVVAIGIKGTVELDHDGLVEFRAWDGDGVTAIGDNSGEMGVTLIRQ